MVFQSHSLCRMLDFLLFNLPLQQTTEGLNWRKNMSKVSVRLERLVKRNSNFSSFKWNLIELDELFRTIQVWSTMDVPKWSNGRFFVFFGTNFVEAKSQKLSEIINISLLHSIPHLLNSLNSQRTDPCDHLVNRGRPRTQKWSNGGLHP